MIKDNDKKRFSVEILYLAVFTAITVMIWISFEVFRSLTVQKEIEKLDPKILQSLDDRIDRESLQKVSERIHISQEILDQFDPVTKTAEEEVTGAKENGTLDQGKESTASGVFE